MRPVLICLLTCCAAALLPATEPIDVILVAGQSNAVGFDAAPSKLPADPIDQEILFWYRCGDPPPDAHDTTSDGWTTLGPQPLGSPIKPRRGRQYGNFAQPDGGFGPEIGLARTIAQGQDRKLAIIKVAFSGTHVAGDWNPTLTSDDQQVSEQDCRGACYRSLVSDPLTCYIDTATASIANNAHFDAAGTIDVGERFARGLSSIAAPNDRSK
jgi:hypothetical protein